MPAGRPAQHRREGDGRRRHGSRLIRRARPVGGRGTEVEVHLDPCATRIDGARECAAARADRGCGARGDVARVVGVREEVLRAGRAVGEEEERRAHGIRLAGGAVRVGRVRRAGRGDRRAQVCRTSASGAGGRVELEDRRRCAALEVAGEHASLPSDVLLPGDVRRGAGERDVGPRRVVQRVGDRLSGIERLEVVAADEARDEDGVAVAADRLGPHHPGNGHATGGQRTGRDARILGVGGAVPVQGTRALLRRALRTRAERVRRARRVQHVRLPLRAAADHDPVEAAVRKSRREPPWPRTRARSRCRSGRGSARTRRPTARRRSAR